MGKAFHGGASFKAIGEAFEHLERRFDVVNADVLDAWYDPSPNVIQALQEHLPWLIKTSPPTHGDGLREVICETRGLEPDHIVLGSGTSSLMYQAIPLLLHQGERAAMLDPTYGEYQHIAEQLIGAQVVRIALEPQQEFRPTVESIVNAAQNASLLVLVNPNSPTGVSLSRQAVTELIGQLNPSTTVWIDETYIDFVPGNQSAESLVTTFPNLIVSKSMSKFYGLSGLRIGYLASSHPIMPELERLSPPWSVGLLAQLAGVEALRDDNYYSEMRDTTVRLRIDMSQNLQSFGLWVCPSDANYLIFRVPEGFAAQFCELTAQQNVWLRNCDSLSPRFRGNMVRTAVKSASDNAKIVAAVRGALNAL